MSANDPKRTPSHGMKTRISLGLSSPWAAWGATCNDAVRNGGRESRGAQTRPRLADRHVQTHLSPTYKNNSTCERASATKHLSSKQQLPRCSKSFLVRPVNSSPYFKRFWKIRSRFVKPSLVCFG